MTIQQIQNYTDCDGNLYLPQPRLYFDCFAHEFSRMDFEAKINTLGALIKEGLSLTDEIQRYCDNRSPHVLTSLNITLLSYIQMVRWGKTHHVTDVAFEDNSPIELAQLLEDEIKLGYVEWSGKTECRRWNDSMLREMVLGGDDISPQEQLRRPFTKKAIFDWYKLDFEISARYKLGTYGKNPLIVFGVNPSIANAYRSDPTIRRVQGYAQRNGFDGFVMLNVYPLIETNPNKLPDEIDIELHSENIKEIKKAIDYIESPTILVAFGNTINIRPYLKDCFVEIVEAISHKKINWKQIGALTKAGNPRHPSRGAYRDLEDCNINLIK
ncbi:MAG: DUF1643 domain-containing protein [Rikenellaceae bacterium]